MTLTTSPSDKGHVHRFVTIEQVIRAEQPETADLRTLFAEWGLTRSTQEAFWVIAFDDNLGLKTITEVARGGFHDVLVYPTTVVSAVLASHTDRFYVAHNHPSGPIEPTEEDIELTVKIMATANAAGLSFEDHIIVGPSGWYSFWEAGLLTRATSLGVRAAMKRGGRKSGR
jgi:DNA repair protein RadC